MYLEIDLLQNVLLVLEYCICHIPLSQHTINPYSFLPNNIYVNFRDGATLDDTLSLSGSCSSARILVEDFDLDGSQDLVVSCGDTVSVIAIGEGDFETVALEATLGVGGGITDLALASLDNGRKRDIYASLDDGQLLWFETDSEEWIELGVEGFVTSVEALDGGNYVVRLKLHTTMCFEN